MTSKEAIKILNLMQGAVSISFKDHQKAVKLGIKALERIDSLRSAGHYIGMPLLKGETI